MNNMPLVFMIAGFVCFILSAIGVGGRINLTATGLALWVLSLLWKG